MPHPLRVDISVPKIMLEMPIMRTCLTLAIMQRVRGDVTLLATREQRLSGKTHHSRVPPPKDRYCVGSYSRVESKGDSTLLP
jgi:hypothetical protein